jgi:signal transduction histidine kinase/ligand-binding sensor domain-containing protein
MRENAGKGQSSRMPSRRETRGHETCSTRPMREREVSAASGCLSIETSRLSDGDPSLHFWKLISVHTANRRAVQRMKYFFVFLMLSLHVSSAGALDPSRTIKQFDHASWTARQGLPGGIAALAQTTDGYLWLATANGLVRFDGVTFERFQPSSGPPFPQKDVTALLATSDGGLWVGYRLGGISFLRNGVLTNYKFPEGTVWDLKYAPDGVLWMSGGFRGCLARFEHGSWRSVGLELGYTEPFAFTLLFDRLGNLWVGGIRTVWVLEKGAARIVGTGVTTNDATHLTEASDGSLWWADESGVLPLLKHLAPVAKRDEHLVLGAPPRGLLVDRDGALWYFAHEEVLRVPSPTATWKLPPSQRGSTIQHFIATDGLSRGDVVASLEDREGSIWIATAVSLDRFRMTTFSPALLGQAAASGFSMSAEPKGGMLISTGSPDLLLLHNGRVSVVPGPPNTTFDSLYEAPDGIIWAGGKGQLAYFQESHYTTVSLPPSFTGNRRNTQAMTLGPDGSLWLSTIGRGLFKLKNRQWTEIPQLDDYPVTAVCLYTDSQGQVWVGYTGGKVAVYAANTVKTYSTTDGLSIGNVMTIYGKDSNIWLAGQHGINLFRNGQFLPIRFEGGTEVEGITGVVEGGDGSLWLNSMSGIVRISQKELLSFLASPDHPVAFTNYDYLDGVEGNAKQLRPVPSACLGTDGRLWFALEGNVVSVDPLHAYSDTFAPPVSIVRAISGSQRQQGGNFVSLAKTARDIEIDYTATSLAVPERVKFKYKLDNGTFQDVGRARQAFLTGLAPGRHTFHVIASNGYGVWNLTGASLVIFRPPVFSETPWFKFLWLLLATFILGALFLIRMRQMLLKAQLRMSERLLERERIARDLHDTLLQGFQGVLLRFQTIAKRAKGDDITQRELEDTIVRADGVLVEARDKVWQLRSASRPYDDLAGSLNATAGDLRKHWGATFSLQVTGTPRPLASGAFDEIYAIAQEALVNAFRHAGARAIEVELQFNQTEFRVRVCDDGHGLPDQSKKRHDQTKHWGLLGMQERAKKLSGRLTWSDRQTGGTEMQLTVPAGVSYRAISSRWKNFIGGE